jgi:hypothetical protein
MSVDENIAKINRFGAPFAAVLGALAWCQPIVFSSDLWWHLATGREILRRGAIPYKDIFSYTAAGQPWTNHEWLWDVGMWATYSVHPDLAAGLQLLAIVGMCALTYRSAAQVSGSTVAATIALWFAAVTMYWFLDVRPHVVTFLLTALVIATRHAPRAPWLWPPLVIVWANVHAGFVFGIGAIGLLALMRTGAATLRARRLAEPVALLGLAGALLACLANPWGWGILGYPAAYLDSDNLYRGIIEWIPPGFGLDPRDYQGRFWWFAVLALPGAALGVRREPYLVALSAVTFAMAVTSRRFIPLFALAAAPLFALAVAAVVGEVVRRRPWLASPRAGLAAVALALVVCVGFWRDVRVAPELLARWTQADLVPDGAIRYAASALPRTLRIFNENMWGGAMLLHDPTLRLFYDGRANTLYDEPTYLDYLRVYQAAPGFRDILARYDIGAVLLSKHSRAARELSRPPDAWNLIYADEQAFILVRPDLGVTRDSLPPVQVVLEGHPDLAVIQGRYWEGQGDYARAVAELERAVAQRPLGTTAWGALARVHGKRGDVQAVEATIARAIALYPRSAPRLRFLESYAYEFVPDPVRALAAMRRARFGSPSNYDDAIREEIARLEKTVAGDP